MTSAEVTRIFVCIELPSSVRAQAGALQRALSALDASLRWVRPSNLHLTLRFLGEIPQSKVESVYLAAQRAASRVEPFSLRLAGTGCFPSLRRPKVFWIGVPENPDLSRLFEVLQEELFSSGFDRETRPFSPHLTLGRFRVDRAISRVREAITGVEFATAPFSVEDVTVMKSELNRSGAIHTALARLPLKTSRASPVKLE